MEHGNPLLKENDNSQRFITIGEIMPRLTPPKVEAWPDAGVKP